MDRSAATFNGLCAVGFLARASYALARTPVLALFAASLGAGPEAIGFCVAISTVTGIFFKMPAGVVSDILGKTRTLFLGLACFAFIPLAYLLVSTYQALVVVRFCHGFATAIYGPVSMAVIVSLAGVRRGEMLSWFSSVTIIGSLLGAPLGGFLLSRLSGAGAPQLLHFHIIYGVVAALGAASLAVALWVLRGRLPEPEPAQGRTLAAVLTQFKTGLKEILLDRRVFLTSNLEGVQNLSLGALEAFLPIYAVQIAGLTAFPGGAALGGAGGGHHRFQAHHGQALGPLRPPASPFLGDVRLRRALRLRPLVPGLPHPAAPGGPVRPGGGRGHLFGCSPGGGLLPAGPPGFGHGDLRHHLRCGPRRGTAAGRGFDRLLGRGGFPRAICHYCRHVNSGGAGLPGGSNGRVFKGKEGRGLNLPLFLILMPMN